MIKRKRGCNHSFSECKKQERIKSLKILIANNSIFNTEKYRQQNFALPDPLIRYVLISSNITVLQKLQESCKFWFLALPTPIVYNLHVNNSSFSEYFQHSLCINESALPQASFSNLCVGNVLKFKCKDRKALSHFMPKIKKCTANLVHLSNQDLSLSEFLILTRNVKHLVLYETKITTNSGNALSKEDIKRMFPSTTIIFFPDNEE